MERIFKAILVFLVAVLSNTAMAQNVSLTVSSISLKQGETGTINIDMSNDVNVGAMSFSLVLVEGLTNSYSGSASKSISWNDKRKPDNSSPSASKLNDLQYNYVIYDADGIDGTGFKGKSGTIASFNVKVADNLPVGDYVIMLKDVTMSDLSGNIKYDDIVVLNSGIVSVYKAAKVSTSAENGYIVMSPASSNNEYKLGTNVKATAVPNEGYSFEKWSDGQKDISTVNPYSFDVNENVYLKAVFIPNEYKLTYKVDGQVYKTENVAYGTSLSAIAYPTKEGYTFSGWIGLPSTMPAKDVVVTGSFDINNYKIIYKVDGQEYKTVTVALGSNIISEPNPTKEGYTFTGWNEIPETMPSHDIVVNGSFTANKYKVYFRFIDKIVHEEDVEYGYPIPSYEYKTEDGIIITKWDASSDYKTMPAHELLLTADLAENIDFANMEDEIDAFYSVKGLNTGKTPSKGLNLVKYKSGRIGKIYIK